MKIESHSIHATLLRSISIVLSLVLILSCDGSHSAPEDAGFLAIKIMNRDSDTDRHTQAPEFDCQKMGAEKVEVMVLDVNNIKINGDDTWEYKKGKGTISSVTAGSNRTVVIVAKDNDENVICRAENSNITVSANKTETVEIEWEEFVPKLQKPEHDGLARVGAIRLEWQEVDGASEYEVSVSVNEDMNSPFIDGDKTEDPYYELSDPSLSNLKKYYWQVVAVDRFHKEVRGWQGESAKSETRSFVMQFFSSIAAGGKHTLAIREGALWSWGNNYYGQLGLGDSGHGTERAQPTRVGTDDDWAHVAAGPFHSVALRTDGTLWGWGKNEKQIFGSDEEMIDEPTQIGKDRDWAYVAAGSHHIAALKTNGQLWAWGDNTHGQLGRDSGNIKSTPNPVNIAKPEGSDHWVHLAAGSDHTFGIDNKGYLLAWGNNENGRLVLREKDDAELLPTKVDSAKDWKYVSTRNTPDINHRSKTSTDLSHTVAVKTNGELFSWGDNAEGQLGQNSSASAPSQVGSISNWTHAVAADRYTLAINEDGELWVWGRNNFGQLGLDATDHRSTERQKVDGDNWAYVSAREDHVVAVTTNDEIFCWGRNTYGQVGNQKTGLKREPVPVQVGKRIVWVSIGQGQGRKEGGESASFVINDNDELWAWGNNYLGRLGLGKAGHQQEPVRVGEDTGWASVSNGKESTIAVKAVESGGSLWSWGSWQGNNPKDKIPEKWDSLEESWVSVYAGDTFFVGLRDDGNGKKSLWTWGGNSHGQLGWGKIDDNRDLNVPAQALLPDTANASWEEMAAGYAHTVAIDTNGTLWTWGSNTHGQLGQGDSGEKTSRYSPTQVTVDGITDISWEAVAAGSNHTIAIDVDGTLWTWGNNQFGQLGHDKGREEQFKPNQVEPEGDVQWLQAAGGIGFTVAIKKNGTLWSWGGNAYGQLGTGSREAESRSPKQIGDDKDWASVGASGSYALAIKTDGTLWSWGDNRYGQLGDGEAWVLLPAQVSFKP